MLILLAVGDIARAASATQILIAPGQKWDDQVRHARPGDEIILMPGEHRPGMLEDIVGTADRPLIIRGLNPEHPAIIKAKLYGIRLIRPRHIVFRDITIEGAEINGLQIDGAAKVVKSAHSPPKSKAATGTAAESEPAMGPVEFINVTVRQTGGDKKKRHAVALDHAHGVSFNQCHFEGWSGSAIEIVGCDEIAVEKCTMIGGQGFKPMAGIRIRAGATNVTVTDSRFEDTGMAGIYAGGVSKLSEFPVGVLENATKATIFEARHVKIEKNIFVGGASAVTMTHSDRVQIQRNTIVNPSYYVFCLLLISDDPLIGATRRATISLNLITWERGAMEKYFLIDEGVELMSLKMDSNLWWSSEALDARTRLGQLPQSERSQQHFQIDPRLDHDFAPLNLEANGYGALPIRVARPNDPQRPESR